MAHFLYLTNCDGGAIEDRTVMPRGRTKTLLYIRILSIFFYQFNSGKVVHFTVLSRSGVGSWGVTNGMLDYRTKKVTGRTPLIAGRSPVLNLQVQITVDSTGANGPHFNDA